MLPRLSRADGCIPKSGSTQGFREGSPVNTLVMQQNRIVMPVRGGFFSFCRPTWNHVPLSGLGVCLFFRRALPRADQRGQGVGMYSRIYRVLELRTVPGPYALGPRVRGGGISSVE